MPHSMTRKIGTAEISIITDGATEFPTDLFPESDPSHIGDMLAQAGQDRIRTNFNAVLLREGNRTILLDAGPRDLFGPSCGNLPAALDELGVTPDQVDTLFATHLHPDHIAGMITAEGAAAFPNATLILPEAERSFWGQESNFTGALASAADWATLARAVMEAYADRLHPIAADAPIAPGLTALPLPGHTPGHSGWRLESGGEMLLHVGDIVHAPDIQFADPDIAIAFDIDMDTARKTRHALLDELATDGALVTGGHLLQPALARVERSTKGYRLTPP